MQRPISSISGFKTYKKKDLRLGMVVLSRVDLGLTLKAAGVWEAWYVNAVFTTTGHWVNFVSVVS